MVSLVVRGVKVSSSVAFANSWAMLVEGLKTVQSRNTTGTDASTADYRSAWPWACAPNVSTLDVRVAMGTFCCA